MPLRLTVFILVYSYIIISLIIVLCNTYVTITRVYVFSILSIKMNYIYYFYINFVNTLSSQKRNLDEVNEYEKAYNILI